MSKIDSFYGDEIYILCADEDRETHGLLKIFERLSRLQGYMATLNVDQAKELRVLHGILTPARYLPSSLRGKSSFLVIQNRTDAEKGLVFETTSSCVGDLAGDISSVVENAGSIALTDFDSIDDLAILWGYEVQICLTIDEDELDEEALDGCIAISAEVKEIAEGGY